jgi:hypothetical protein
MTISEHIVMTEATFIQTAEIRNIKNTPDLDSIRNMKRLAEKVFEPMRNHFGVPIKVSSFFRSIQLNKAVGGSANSQHCIGQAMDISVQTHQVSNADLFNFIRDNLEFDQLIWEFGDDDCPEWVHVSYSDQNRLQIFRSVKSEDKTVYSTL